MSNETTNTGRKYGRVRFSLKALLFVITLAAGILGYVVIKAQRNLAMISGIQQMGGMVTFAHEVAEDGTQLPIPRSPGPRWLRHILGDHYFARVVKIAFDRPDDETIASLCELDLSSIEHLLLAGGPFSDKGLSCLTSDSLSGLRRLRIDETRISDEGLFVLSKNLPTLEKLYLSSTNVGNEGIAHLSNMRRLHFLDVFYTKVDANGINALKAKLPQLKVVGP